MNLRPTQTQEKNNSFFSDRIIFLVESVILLFIGIGIGYLLFAKQTTFSNTSFYTPEVSRPPAATPTPESSQTPLALYNATVLLPKGWQMQELNRRTEPPGPNLLGHDCAEYVISSDDATATLFLIPTCGVLQTTPQFWPQDTVIVKSEGNGVFIIRYFDSNKKVYRYARGIEETTTSTTNPTQRVTDGVLIFDAKQPLISITAQGSFLGQKDN